VREAAAVVAREAVEAEVAGAVAEAAVAVADDANPCNADPDLMEITMIAYRMLQGARAKGRARMLLVSVAAFAFAVGFNAASAAQKTFASAEAAANALVQAAKAHDRAATLSILGESAASWISSGDKVADRALGDKFVASYETKHSLTANGDTMTLNIGDNDYPFAFPIVKSGDKWHFDTEAGKNEMLARRIGENELSAIKVLQAIVDAQREYASVDRNGDGVLDYAQKFVSSPGKKDGLYWKTAEGEAPSPLGPLVAEASAQGYKGSGGKGPTPYHGYYYRMLKGQGKNAVGGAFDYVLRGHGIAGYAAIAYPAKYGSSGIMTFMVNQDGKVYQADLGPNTQARATAIQRFDPDKAWTEVVAN